MKALVLSIHIGLEFLSARFLAFSFGVKEECDVGFSLRRGRLFSMAINVLVSTLILRVPMDVIG